MRSSRLVFAVQLPDGYVDVDHVRDTIRHALWLAGLAVRDGTFRDGILEVPVLDSGDPSAPDPRAALERAVPGSVVWPLRRETDRTVRGGERRPARRFVNTWIAEDGSDVRCDGGLRPDAYHVTLVRIGEFDERSYFARNDAEWRPPADHRGFVSLTAVLTVGGVVAAESPLRLPARGSSTACSCPETGHVGGCPQPDWARLHFRTPRGPGQVTATVQICRGNAVLHAQQLVLTIGEGASPVPSVTTDLTPTFNVSGFNDRPRAASVLLDADQVVLRARGTSYAYRARDRGIDAAALKLRNALVAAHFGPDGPRTRVQDLRPVFDSNLAKSKCSYAADLAGLAQAGWELFDGMFDIPARRALKEALRSEVADLQITGVGTSEVPVLWPLLYDIPLSGNVNAVSFCPSVAAFGPGGRGDCAVPGSCPAADTHTGDTICPFGFWGLAHHLEQIPACRADAMTCQNPTTADLALSLVVGRKVPSRDLLEEHIAALRKARYAVGSTSPRTHRGVAESLAGETTVAYMLSHCGYEGDNGVYLDYEDRVFPRTVSLWQQEYWPEDHWKDCRPLVVLNGCHTMHATSGTLASFVTTFVEAGASGVIGSEVVITQDLAGWAMELLLAALADGQDMSAAVRSMRWSMLRQGNVMGLAYSPYCLINRRYQKTI